MENERHMLKTNKIRSILNDQKTKEMMKKQNKKQKTKTAISNND